MGGELAVVEPPVPQLHTADTQAVVVRVLEVELVARVRAVGLEADGEQDEGHVGQGDGEPGDELVLQGRHPATQQRLQEKTDNAVKKYLRFDLLQP